MKRHILMIISLIVGLLASAQDTFYYYGDKKIPLKENDEKVLVLSDEGQEFNLGKLSNLTFERRIRFEGMEDRIYANLSSKSFAAIRKRIKSVDTSLKVCRGYTLANGETVYGTHKFAVKLRKEDDIYTLKDVAEKFGCRILSVMPYMPLWFNMEVTEENGLNGLEAANLFYETGLFMCAESIFGDNERDSDRDRHGPLKGTIK